MKYYSIIIPVYNASRYIGKCIESIQAQTNPNWRLIVVDDGSVDDSLKICKQYSEIDNRIIVLHQENKGPGLARNYGLENAKGDYVVFVDADDYLSEDYLASIDSHDEDVVFFNLQNVTPEGVLKTIDKMSINGSLTKEQFIRQQMTGKITWGGVRKCVKTCILKDNGICFSSHKIGEEAIYSFMVLYYANTIAYVDKAIYMRVLRDDSQSHLPVMDPWGDVALALKKKITELGVFPEYANTINAFILTATIRHASRLAKNYSYPEFIEKLKDCILYFNTNRDHNYPIDFCSMDKRIRILSFLVLNRLYLIFWFIIKIR